jgi:predicted DNA-binding protein (UPF0251 family)
MPESNLYGPINGTNTEKEVILMAIEEYETIRLIDFEGLTQEQCAIKMHVARTTVQNIYNFARNKLAESLINGNIIQIEGGDYQLYTEKERMNCCGRCNRNRCGKNHSFENSITE